MSNERLRAAIVSAGLTVSDVSERASVDPKTIERWISKERVPHRTHRLSVAALLGQDDHYLWPTTALDPRTRSASADEFVAIHPSRGSVPAGTWTALLDQAGESVDLLAFAGSFLNDTIPDFADQLVEKARAGVQVRLLFGDPDSRAVAVRGEEEGIGDLLAARCRLTWAYFTPAIGQPGVLARQHGCTLYASVFRFDSTLLANTHCYGAPANHAPVIHLHRIAGGRLFDGYMRSFERVWERGTDVAREGSGVA
jgi:hypothetical protein